MVQEEKDERYYKIKIQEKIKQFIWFYYNVNPRWTNRDEDGERSSFPKVYIGDTIGFFIIKFIQSLFGFSANGKSIVDFYYLTLSVNAFSLQGVYKHIVYNFSIKYFSSYKTISSKLKCKVFWNIIRSFFVKKIFININAEHLIWIIT